MSAGDDHRELVHESLSQEVIGAAIEVHKALGPGLLESAYEACLARELALRDVPVRRQVELPLRYKGEMVDAGFRIDLLVGDRVIVEIKAVDRLIPVHEAQLLTYLKLAEKRVGLLINFNVPLLKDGLVRRVL